MRGPMALLAMIGYAAASSGALSQSARAESFSAASGSESNDGNQCFKWNIASGSVGLMLDPAQPDCMRHYYMPLYWKTFFSAGTQRSITVTGRSADSASEMSCGAFVYDSNGLLVSQAVGLLPITGANYGTKTFTVTNVLASGTSYVSCSPKGNSWMLKVDWSP